MLTNNSSYNYNCNSFSPIAGFLVLIAITLTNASCKFPMVYIIGLCARGLR